MGIFINSRSKIFKEVEIDGKETGTANTTDYSNQSEDTGDDTSSADTNDTTQDSGNDNDTTDYTKTPEESNDQEDNTQEENTDQQDETQQDDSGNDEGTTDYTQMPEGDESGEDTSNDSGTDDSSSGSSGGSSDEEKQEVDDIKAQEEELFKNLSPEQLDIRHKELKNKYLEMFDMVNAIIERIGNISVEDISVIEYVSNTLSNLRIMLSDYMNSVYKTKSYTENLVNYNRFLAVLNGVGKILEEISKKKD